MLKRTLCCGQTPRLCLMALSSVRMSRSRMKAVPEVGGKRPVRMDLQHSTMIGGDHSRAGPAQEDLGAAPGPKGQNTCSKLRAPLVPWQ